MKPSMSMWETSGFQFVFKMNIFNPFLFYWRLSVYLQSLLFLHHFKSEVSSLFFGLLDIQDLKLNQNTTQRRNKIT